MNLNFRQSPQWSERKEKKREEKGGWGGYFLAFSLLSDLITLHRARQPSLPLPLASLTLHILSYKTLTSSIFLRICHNMNMPVGGRGGGCGGSHGHNHHTCLCSLFELPFFFYTLHSSADGLCIDFALSCLGLALWACGRLCGGGGCMCWYSKYILKQHCWLVTISLVWLSKCEWIWKKVSINSQIQLFRKTVQVLAGGKRFWGSTQDKSTC